MNCQRCKTGEIPWANGACVLYGGVNAHLCVACLNEWHALVENSPIGDEIERLDAEESHHSMMALAGQPVDRAAVGARVAAERANRAAGFALGLEFIEPIRVEAAEG
jgi:hypothetical protein